MDNILATRFRDFFKLAMGKIWITNDKYSGKKYVIIHYLDHSDTFRKPYTVCYTQDELNNAKSEILNNGFKINWDSFDLALSYLNNN